MPALRPTVLAAFVLALTGAPAARSQAPADAPVPSRHDRLANMVGRITDIEASSRSRPSSISPRRPAASVRERRRHVGPHLRALRPRTSATSTSSSPTPTSCGRHGRILPAHIASDGIYKSTDGGRTHQHGAETRTISARCLSTPSTPTSYVAAQGHLWAIRASGSSAPPTAAAAGHG